MHWFASIEDAQAKIDAWRWDALIEKQLAIEDERAIFPGGARAVLLTGQAPYLALGIPDVRHRRGKDATPAGFLRTSDYWRTAPVSVRRARKVQTISRPSCGLSVVEAEKSAEAALFIIDRRLRGSLGTQRECCTGCVATSASGGW